MSRWRDGYCTIVGRVNRWMDSYNGWITIIGGYINRFEGWMDGSWLKGWKIMIDGWIDRQIRKMYGWLSVWMDWMVTIMDGQL